MIDAYHHIQLDPRFRLQCDNEERFDNDPMAGHSWDTDSQLHPYGALNEGLAMPDEEEAPIPPQSLIADHPPVITGKKSPEIKREYFQQTLPQSYSDFIDALMGRNTPSI